jgi:hypothetical protein
VIASDSPSKNSFIPTLDIISEGSYVEGMERSRLDEPREAHQALYYISVKMTPITDTPSQEF